MTSIHATPRLALSEFAGGKEVQEERRPLGESDAGNATAAGPAGGDENVSPELTAAKAVKSEVKKAATGATKKRGLKRL